MLGCIRASFLSELKDVELISVTTSSVLESTQKNWRYIPSLPLFGDYCYRLPVVFGDYPKERFTTVGLERNLVTYRELKHMRMRAGLIQKAQPRNDSIVVVDQLRLGKAVDVNRWCHCLSRTSLLANRPASRRYMRPSICVRDGLPGPDYKFLAGAKALFVAAGHYFPSMENANKTLPGEPPKMA